jgi:hypothetical protein
MSQPIYANGGDGGATKVSYDLNLDPAELFGQFCVYPSLVKFGPRRGVFLGGTVRIVQPGQGVMRVWKHWLQDRAQEAWRNEASPGCNMDEASIGADKNIMWTDYRKNVGLRVAIRDPEGRCCGKEPFEYDDIPMSFSMEIQGN